MFDEYFPSSTNHDIPFGSNFPLLDTSPPTPPPYPFSSPDTDLLFPRDILSMGDDFPNGFPDDNGDLLPTAHAPHPLDTFPPTPPPPSHIPQDEDTSLLGDIFPPERFLNGFLGDHDEQAPTQQIPNPLESHSFPIGKNERDVEINNEYESSPKRCRREKVNPEVKILTQTNHSNMSNGHHNKIVKYEPKIILHRNPIEVEVDKPVTFASNNGTGESVIQQTKTTGRVRTLAMSHPSLSTCTPFEIDIEIYGQRHGQRDWKKIHLKDNVRIEIVKSHRRGKDGVFSLRIYNFTPKDYEYRASTAKFKIQVPKLYTKFGNEKIEFAMKEQCSASFHFLTDTKVSRKK